MLQKTRLRALPLIALILSLGGSCLLTGCASWFERFYKPASASYGSTKHLERAYAPSEMMPRVPISWAALGRGPNRVPLADRRALGPGASVDQSRWFSLRLPWALSRAGTAVRGDRPTAPWLGKQVNPGAGASEIPSRGCARADDPSIEPVRGGSAIVSPFAHLPWRSRSTDTSLCCAPTSTLNDTIRGGYDLDVVGRYARPDVGVQV